MEKADKLVACHKWGWVGLTVGDNLRIRQNTDQIQQTRYH